MRAFLIPARSGSKTVLDKNIVDLGGQPLLAWSIGTAREAAAGTGAPVYVTSDDSKILDIAEGYKAIPHVRQAHLADDQATMRDVVREFFKAHEDLVDIVLLYPTCPFRTAATVKSAIACYDDGTMAGPHTSLMSVHAHKGRPFGGVHIMDGKMVFPSEAEGFYRKQDTPSLYFANGAIYIINRDVIDKLNTQLFCAETVPYIMYGIENIDIDTAYDLEIARALVAAKGVKVSPRGAIECV